MTQALYILLAIGAGFGTAMQTGLIGSLSRARGPVEAAWVSVLATICGIAIVLGVRSAKLAPPAFPAPFDSPFSFAAVLVLAAATLVISMKGVESYLAAAGLLGFVYLFTAAFVAPRAGIAVFTASFTAGTLMGAVILDHFGAFGASVERISASRVLGIFALLGGVLLIRGR